MQQLTQHLPPPKPLTVSPCVCVCLSVCRLGCPCILELVATRPSCHPLLLLLLVVVELGSKASMHGPTKPPCCLTNFLHKCESGSQHLNANVVDAWEL